MPPTDAFAKPAWRAAVIAGGAVVLLGLGLLAGLILSDGRPAPAPPAAAAAAKSPDLNRTADKILVQGQGVYQETVVSGVDRHVNSMLQAPVDAATQTLQSHLPGFLAPEVAQLGGMAKTRLRDSAVAAAETTGETGFGGLHGALAAPEVAPAPWCSVELGRFAQMPRADAYAQQMASLGVGARTAMTTGADGRPWVSVRTGLYADQGQAEKALDELRRRGFSGTVVSEPRGSGGHAEK